jgi:hypothetical protein
VLYTQRASRAVKTTAEPTITMIGWTPSKLQCQFLIVAAAYLATTASASMIDPSTPTHAPPREGYELVFSDEFTESGRNFKDGEDGVWTAMDKNDYTNSALHYYKPEAVQTEDGKWVGGG